MNFIAAIKEGEDIEKVGKAYEELSVNNIKLLKTIGIITGTSDLTLEELKITGIDNLSEEKEVFI